MEKFNPLAFNELPTSTLILMAVCVFSAILLFVSFVFSHKKSTKIFYAIISGALVLAMTCVTAFPIYFNESTSEVLFSEKTLEIDVDRAFYPEKTTKFIMKNEKGKEIASLVVEDTDEKFDDFYNNYSKVQAQSMQPGSKFIKFNWCIVYENESGELCCISHEEYNKTMDSDPFFRRIYENTDS